MEEVQIDFWVGKTHYAIRHTFSFVPCIGDEVRFHGEIYKVRNRVWVYDESAQRVALNLAKLNIP
jgi:hypothetical protein